MLVKELDGPISVNQHEGEAPVGTALGLLMGGIVGILGGPAGAAVGSTIGGYIGPLVDWARSGINLQFLDDAGKTLKPGKAAVLAEIEQGWCPLLEPLLQQQGATVFRRFRTDVLEEQLLREERALDTSLQHLMDDLDQADEITRQAVEKSIADVKRELASLEHRTKASASNVLSAASTLSERQLSAKRPYALQFLSVENLQNAA